ncbi:MAG: DNA translocase FtsK 4TM domain-containing protein [Pseudomonadota bacterium]
MSFEYQDTHHDRFLPEPLHDRLMGFATRLGGLCVLAAIAATWLSLLTWSSTDPSLTHTTSEPALNMLGFPGAVISDLMLQSFGVACVVLLLVPTFWALEMAMGRTIVNLGSKVTYFPFALLVLAGAMSSLPTAGAAGWPLHHGFGGIIGDVVYRLTSSIAAMLVSENAAWATGLILFAFGFFSVATAIGMEWRDFVSGFSRSGQSDPASDAFSNRDTDAGPRDYRDERPELNLGGEVPRRWLDPVDDEFDDDINDLDDIEDEPEPFPVDAPAHKPGRYADHGARAFDRDEPAQSRVLEPVPAASPDQQPDPTPAQRPPNPSVDDQPLLRPRAHTVPAADPHARIQADNPMGQPMLRPQTPVTSRAQWQRPHPHARENPVLRGAAHFPTQGRPQAQHTFQPQATLQARPTAQPQPAFRPQPPLPRPGLHAPMGTPAEAPATQKPAPRTQHPEPAPKLKPRFQSLKDSLAQHSHSTLVAMQSANWQPSNWPRSTKPVSGATQASSGDPAARGRPEHDVHTDDPLDPMVEDNAFDRDTDAASLAIARRFAPARVLEDDHDPQDDTALLRAAAPAPSSRPERRKTADQRSVSLPKPATAGAAFGRPDASSQPSVVEPIDNPITEHRSEVGPAPAAMKSTLLRGMKFKAKRGYQRPSLNLLTQGLARGAKGQITDPDLKANAELLTQVLNDFGVKGEVRGIAPGPVVTLYEFEPARGIKSSRVIGLADDIARSMSALSARVAVIPGRNLIGIELPNSQRQVVLLRDLMEAEAYRTVEGGLPLVLGKSIGGDPVVEDLASMPHLLVAGTTGSGKSVGVNAMILSLLYRFGPDQLRFLMIDPKMLELSVYNDIPHLLAPVVTEPEKAVDVLAWVVNEMEERYKRMSQLSVRNIDVFNNRVRNAKKRGETIARMVQTGFDTGTGQPVFEKQPLDMDLMPRIVVVIDEFADLMMVAGKEVEGHVQRLAQMARAAGIHLIMSTQRPSVDVITGTIKANFPTRMSFKVASKIDSRTILNEQGAEQLLGQGDMLFSAGGGSVRRLHGPYVADDEVEAIANALRAGGSPQYVDLTLPMADEANQGANASKSHDLFDEAVAIVVRDQRVSTSYLQRRLSIGYNRAANLVDRLFDEGIVSAPDGSGRRKVLQTALATTAAADAVDGAIKVESAAAQPPFAAPANDDDEAA